MTLLVPFYFSRLYGKQVCNTNAELAPLYRKHTDMHFLAFASLYPMSCSNCSCQSTTDVILMVYVKLEISQLTA